MSVLNDYIFWAKGSKIRLYVATPLLALFLLAVAWSFLTWIF